jgi:hypothetical protein
MRFSPRKFLLRKWVIEHIALASSRDRNTLREVALTRRSSPFLPFSGIFRTAHGVDDALIRHQPLEPLAGMLVSSSE